MTNWENVGTWVGTNHHAVGVGSIDEVPTGLETKFESSSPNVVPIRPALPTLAQLPIHHDVAWCQGGGGAEKWSRARAHAAWTDMGPSYTMLDSRASGESCQNRKKLVKAELIAC